MIPGKVPRTIDAGEIQLKEWSVIHKIKAMYDEGNGQSIRGIAQALRLSRNTVRKYLKLNLPVFGGGQILRE